MALASTQPLTDMGVKAGQYIRLTTLPPSCADCLEICEPEALEPTGPVQACTGIATYFKVLNSCVEIELFFHAKS
jgi:hypothetical protein